MTNFLQPDPQISQISPNLVIFQLDELSGKSKFSQGPNAPIIKKKANPNTQRFHSDSKWLDVGIRYYFLREQGMMWLGCP